MARGADTTPACRRSSRARTGPIPAPPELHPGGGGTTSTIPTDYPVDWRGLAYTYAYIGIKRLGAGQFYLINIKDKDGESYDGGKTYRLHVPPERAGRAVLVGDRLRPARPTR